MDPEFWKDRWREGRTRFHEGTPNTFLVEHAARIPGKRVLVPLCGKTEDLAYLAAQGHEVVGIELVADAVRAFFAEHGITPEVAGNRYTAGAITLIASDLFAVAAADVGPIDAIYDRAALIALPAELRARYIAHLRALAPAGTPGLLVTIEYPQELRPGPPFSVVEAEVRGHYARVEELAHRGSQDGGARDLAMAIERAYAVAL